MVNRPSARRADHRDDELFDILETFKKLSYEDTSQDDYRRRLKWQQLVVRVKGYMSSYGLGR